MVDTTHALEIGTTLEPDPGGASSSPENPLLLVHRLLRGRYLLAIALGVVLATVGGVAGYHAMKPMYESRGIIQVVPALPKMLYESDESKVPPLFDSFVHAQGEFVKTRRVFDLALQDPKLQATDWPTGAAGIGMLSDSVSVGVPRRGQIIIVTVQQHGSQMAQQAVNSVLRAYKRLYIDERGHTRIDRQQFLEQRDSALQAELRSLRTRISDVAEEYGADNIVRLHAAKVDELTDLDEKIHGLDLAIAQADARSGVEPNADAPLGSVDAEGPVKRATDPLIERDAIENSLASMDTPLAKLLAEEKGAQRQLASLEIAGFGPKHRNVIRLKNNLKVFRQQIEDRVALLQDKFGSTPLPAVATNANASASSEQLRQLRSRYQQMRDEVQSQAEFLATRRGLIASLQADANEKDRLLQDTRTALEELRVEMRRQDETTGRISIASWGDAPVAPSKDRRIPTAAIGVCGGLGAGVGLIAMIGFLFPSCRFVDDLVRPTRTAPLLGSLPNLDSNDPEQEELAALSIHQIRNVLELQHAGFDDRGRVYTITSATSGEGKTSLTMALGMSFAAAGRRTLILDADLIGRGVTGHLKLDGMPGLRELSESAPLTQCAHRTQVDNLFAAPTGNLDGFEPKNLSRGCIARLLDEMRLNYDVVMVDTGPILGSLEGNLVSSLSEGTILLVTRGQSSKLVQASLERIENIGGACVGTVFNRALAEDYRRSVSHASFQVSSARGSHQPSNENGLFAGSRLLVHAVAGDVRGADDEGVSGAA